MLTPVGVAAGIAAAFNARSPRSPFTIGEIVGSLDHSVLRVWSSPPPSPGGHRAEHPGVHPMIRVEQAYGLDDPRSLLPYALLGVAAAVVSVAFTDALLAQRAGSRDARAPRLGAARGRRARHGRARRYALAARSTRRRHGRGYATLQRARWPARAPRARRPLRPEGRSDGGPYSSGGAGGVSRRRLHRAMLGGAVGHPTWRCSRTAAVARLVRARRDGRGVRGRRAPITSVLIIFEMTGAYGLVLPLMLANATSYVLARHWRPVPLYEALLAQDGVTLPVGRAELHALDALTVRDAMTRGW